MYCAAYWNFDVQHENGKGNGKDTVADGLHAIQFSSCQLIICHWFMHEMKLMQV